MQFRAPLEFMFSFSFILISQRIYVYIFFIHKEQKSNRKASSSLIPLNLNLSTTSRKTVTTVIYLLNILSDLSLAFIHYYMHPLKMQNIILRFPLFHKWFHNVQAIFNIIYLFHLTIGIVLSSQFKVIHLIF